MALLCFAAFTLDCVTQPFVLSLSKYERLPFVDLGATLLAA